ncbi:MAG: hypothetical protein KC933_12800 [Myxococcales bacterium]|nr:hypothetical protein [Myxococcales bacterium]
MRLVLAPILGLTLFITLPALAEEPPKKADPHAHAHGGPESPYTLKEVMQALALAEQQIQVGLLTNNRLMVAEGAKAIARHPRPKGGIEPYVKKPHDKLAETIQEMDKRVHGSAVSMFKSAKTASMLELQKLNDEMIRGCIQCHDLFRD